jgi:hypothetical protein
MNRPVRPGLALCAAWIAIVNEEMPVLKKHTLQTGAVTQPAQVGG